MYPQVKKLLCPLHEHTWTWVAEFLAIQSWGIFYTCISDDIITPFLGMCLEVELLS